MNETRESRLPSPAELKALIEAERTGIPFVPWAASHVAGYDQLHRVAQRLRG